MRNAWKSKRRPIESKNVIPAFFRSALNVVIIGMLLAMAAFNGINLLSERSVSRVLAAVSKHGPVSDAQAAYYEPAAQTNAGSVIAAKPIRLEDQAGGGVIIGQFAKIPPHNEDITEVRHVYPVDKQAARELLSIIAKY